MLKIEKRLTMEDAKAILKDTGYTDGFVNACSLHAVAMNIEDGPSKAKLVAFALAMFANGYDICKAQNEKAPT